MTNLTPPIKKHGGKNYLAKKILAIMPPHDCYLEPYFGGGAVLLAKPQSDVAEYANDLDSELTTFWAILRDPDLFRDFQLQINLTPFSSNVFLETLDGSVTTDPVEAALRFFVNNRMSRQALGKDYCTPTTRLRRGINEQVSAYLSAVDGLAEVHARLRTVEVWNRPAIEAIRKLDRPSLLVYADPPYLHATRATTKEYGQYEMNLVDHLELLEVLQNMKGKFILSGYSNAYYGIYEQLHDWHRIDIASPNHASSKKTKEIKTECLWTNFVPTISHEDRG